MKLGTPHNNGESLDMVNVANRREEHQSHMSSADKILAPLVARGGSAGEKTQDHSEDMWPPRLGGSGRRRTEPSAELAGIDGTARVINSKCQFVALSRRLARARVPTLGASLRRRRGNCGSHRDAALPVEAAEGCGCAVSS